MTQHDMNEKLISEEASFRAIPFTAFGVLVFRALI